MNGLLTYPGKKIRYLWSDTQKSVIMELLAACEIRYAVSIKFLFHSIRGKSHFFLFF